MSDNRLILLGTKGGPRIGKGTAWPTSNLLVVEGKPYLIDAGLGVTRQVCNAGFLPFDIDRIFLTHNHSDHNLELGGFHSDRLDLRPHVRDEDLRRAGCGKPDGALPAQSVL